MSYFYSVLLALNSQVVINYPSVNFTLSNWKYVAYPDSAFQLTIAGSDKFVMFSTSYSGDSYYSTNGVNWTKLTLPNPVAYRWLTYANGIYVAFNTESLTSGEYSSIYSTNGITWYNSTFKGLDGYNNVGSSYGTPMITYGNGKFILVVNWEGVNKAYYSTNGITWTTSTVGNSSVWYNLIYGNKFIMINSDATQVCTSTDGITWTASSTDITATGSCTALVYMNSYYFIIKGYNLYKSTNGINWTLVSDIGFTAAYIKTNASTAIDYLVLVGKYINDGKSLYYSDGTVIIEQNALSTPNDTYYVDNNVIIQYTPGIASSAYCTDIDATGTNVWSYSDLTVASGYKSKFCTFNNIMLATNVDDNYMYVSTITRTES